MELRDRTIVVTGGGSGIGRALVERFARDLAVVDRDRAAASAVAERVGGFAVTADLTTEEGVLTAVAAVEERSGPIDVWVSNAGSSAHLGGVEVADAGWDELWKLHVMAHVWAARALLPAMRARDDGYLVSTVSAAALAMGPGAVPYTVSKHAALALAESLAVLQRGTGVRVSCLCPALVDTPLVRAMDGTAPGRAVHAAGAAVPAGEVAEALVTGLREERFLILSHPEVAEVAELRAKDPETYLETFAGLWNSVTEPTTAR